MAIIYYSVGTVDERIEEIGKLPKRPELKGQVRQSPQPVAESSGVELERRVTDEQPTTVPRSAAVSAPEYTILKKLKSLRIHTTSPKDIAEINRDIRTEREPPKRQNMPQLEEFADMNNSSIGRFYVSNRSKSPQNILIGDTKYIENVRFDFVERRRYPIPGGYLVRVTAALTEEGKKVVNRYCINYKRENVDYRKNAKRKSKGAIRKQMRNRNTFDIVVEGINVHFNRGVGKVSIHLDYPDISELLCGVNVSELQRQRYIENRRYIPSGQWIGTTTQDFNNFMGNALMTMARVYSNIFPNGNPG